MLGSRTGRWVWVVAGLSALVQLVVGSVGRAPSWDEAIYLSQVSRGAEALPLVASRARGITLVVAPLASVGAPLWLVRVILVLVTAALAGFVFRLWVPPLGWGAVIGTALLMGSWPVLFYGSEVMPNLWAALLGVGTLGFVARCTSRDAAARPDLIGAGAMAALMALMRPPDAVVLVLAAAIVLVAVRSSWRAVLALLGGAVVGTLPWLIEMSIRFGGPLDAVRDARTVSHLGSASSGPVDHLRLTDGPLLGPDVGASVPVIGLLWWIGLIVLAAWAIRPGGDRPRLIALRLLVLCAVALAATYLLLISGLAPRFLLPALALLSLAAGGGLDDIRRSGAMGRAGVAAAVVVLTAWLGWQVATFDRLEAQASDERALPAAVGEAIHDTVGAPCVVASTDDYPQVAFAAGCAGRFIAHPDDGVVADPYDRRVVLVTRGDRMPGAEVALTPVDLGVTGWSAWLVEP